MTYMRLAQDPVMRMLLSNFMNQEQETERKCRWMPATNVTEDKGAYHIEMAAPGFNKEDFKLSMERFVLTVSTELEKEQKSAESEEPQYHMREFGRKNFSRSFSLPETVDQDSIKAEYLNGILTVTLPKKEEVKVTKEIQVV
jgi:HSP20 family protein